MAQQLFFQFRDGALTLKELIDEESRQRHGSSPWSFHRVSHRLLTILSVGLDFLSREEQPAKHELFEALMPVATNRMTSKMEDETVCLSTLLDVDRRPMLDRSHPDRVSYRARSSDTRNRPLVRKTFGELSRELCVLFFDFGARTAMIRFHSC
jgi:hypothetical protein